MVRPVGRRVPPSSEASPAVHARRSPHSGLGVLDGPEGGPLVVRQGAPPFSIIGGADPQVSCLRAPPSNVFGGGGGGVSGVVNDTDSHIVVAHCAPSSRGLSVGSGRAVGLQAYC